jgi:ABC-2 type transport system permease protein
MTIALILRNLRHQRRMILATAVGLAAFEILLSWAASQIERNAGLRSLVQFLPPAVQQMLSSQLAYVSFPGAVAFGFGHPVALAASIAFVIVAATTPIAEIETGFLDIVLARAVPRRSYLTATLASVVLGSLLAPAALFAGAGVGLSLADLPSALPWERYVRPAVELGALLLGVGGCALLLAAGAKRRGVAIGRAVGFTLGTFFLDFLTQIRPEIRWAQYFSPFHYFRPVAAALTPELPAGYLIALGGLFVGTAAIAFVVFDRRDI